MLYDLTTILRNAFLDKDCVQSLTVKRYGLSTFHIAITVPPGADQTPVHGTLKDIRRIRPDLRIELFVEEA